MVLSNTVSYSCVYSWFQAKWVRLCGAPEALCGAPQLSAALCIPLLRCVPPYSVAFRYVFRLALSGEPHVFRCVPLCSVLFRQE